jgi:hypothetical protein
MCVQDLENKNKDCEDLIIDNTNNNNTPQFASDQITLSNSFPVSQ